ncbi:hypothetical protein ACKI14_46345 [Streptomyces turgidiscabies]|uniref:hypothetical protein n=1 Tax=Streptomyces turgidiscabies TaxID=85558 RepID=UPI0038F7EFB0
MTALELDMKNPADLDMFIRLVLIAEQAHDPARSLHAQLATTVLTHGPDIARADAYNHGGETGARVVERVISYVSAIRTTRVRYWTVSYVMNGHERTGAMIESPEKTRAQYEWAARRFGADAARITEYTDTLTSVPVDPDALPRDDRRRAPSVPGAHRVTRFYAFDGEGPAAIPDAAAVALARKHLRAARPRRFALPPVLLDTVRVVMTRAVTIDGVAHLG